MREINVKLQTIVSNTNLPTVIKTAVLPGEAKETLFFATLKGEIYYVNGSRVEKLLDISSRILQLGANNGYDERGLLGLAFHPNFNQNGLFYVHYSVAGSQGPGPIPYTDTTNEVLDSFSPNPCDLRTLNLVWSNRETEYDHIDTVEEWGLSNMTQPQKNRTLLNLRRPFANHNGIDTLIFSPETNKLVLTTGDGGSGYDPFNLSQNILEIPGKIIEIDIQKNVFTNNLPAVTRFNEIPIQIQDALTVILKGGRNLTGISYQRFNNRFIKYVGSVGQDLVESIFAYINYRQIPVTEITNSYSKNNGINQVGLINLGWRGWEGDLPTTILKQCSSNSNLNGKVISFYNEVINTSVNRLKPLTCHYHQDNRQNKFSGSALTNVKPYMGNLIPQLNGTIIFTDWAKQPLSLSPLKGVLAYTKYNHGMQNNYGIINVMNDKHNENSFYVSLGTNMDQSRIFLGTYGSANVTDLNLGTIYELIP